MSANRAAAQHYAADPVEAAFLAQVQYARQPWGATVERYPLVEELCQEMFRDLSAQASDARRSDGTVDRAALRRMIAHATNQAAQRIDAALRN